MNYIFEYEYVLLIQSKSINIFNMKYIFEVMIKNDHRPPFFKEKPNLPHREKTFFHFSFKVKSVRVI